MANTHTSLSSLFTDIADAIREKTGDAGTIVADEFPYYIRDYLQKAPQKPYLTFKSPNSFSISTTKGWNGVMEYSTDASTWAEWDGSEISSSWINGAYKLFFRGTGNAKVTGDVSGNYKWSISGADVLCEGNIENLLDYAIVEDGNHPTMANFCYSNMFYGCTSLTKAPDLPATTLTIDCYSSMFYGCTSLTKAPDIPATTLTDHCYQKMFQNCTSLTQAPDLPATTLATYCYQYMFSGCTSLTQAPDLPATTLANNCYQYMFSGCAKIKLSSTQTGEYTVAYRIPSSGTGTTAPSALSNMFKSTGGTFTGTPEINTTYYLSVPDTEKPYLKFISPNEFFIGAYNQGKTWDGTLEYSTDKITWTEWDGTSDMNAAASNGEYVLYLRGTGNSKIGDCFYSEGTDVRCIGNIENILDYTVVSEGGHPTMGENCFAGLFDESNTPTNWLIQAPELIADKLSVGCYMSMFLSCKKLTAIPSLPAHGDGTIEGDEMPGNCYSYMFSGCTSIKLSETNTGEYTQEYRIPATGTYGSGLNCMDDMFKGTGGTFTGTPSINTTYYLSNTNEIV